LENIKVTGTSFKEEDCCKTHVWAISILVAGTGVKW